MTTNNTNPPLSNSTAARQGIASLITVQVGPDHTQYALHKALLVHHSEYFKRALNGRWQEAEEGVVVLKDVETEVFNVFVDWLYTQKLPMDDDRWGYIASSVAEPNSYCCFRADLLRIKLYAFADRFVVPQLYTDTNRQIVKGDINLGEYFFLDVITYAFTHVAADDPLLEYYLDANSRNWVPFPELDDEWYAQLPHDFLIRFMAKRTQLMQLQKAKKSTKITNICKYHGHRTDKEKEACKKEARRQRRIELAAEDSDA